MNLWQYLDSRGDRREARRLLLIERGLDWRSMIQQTAKGFDARLLIAGTIIALFAIAFLRETDKDTRNLMVGALIAAFAGAWGYYLGSSSGASKAADRADASLQLANNVARQLPPPPAPPPALELEPGQRATVAAAPDEERRD